MADMSNLYNLVNQKLQEQNLPDLKTMYQQNLFKPASNKWYKGDEPNIRESLGQILLTSIKDPQQGARMQNAFSLLMDDPTSRFWSPYKKATNNAVNNLASYGFDVGNLNDEWINANRGWIETNLVRNGTTNAPSKPGTKATDAQKIAYELYQYSKGSETTKKAKQEWSALQEETRYWTNRKDLNLSDDEIINKIYEEDFAKKYPTLSAMDDSLKRLDKDLLELNEGIDYSRDALYGTIWAARNKSSGNVYQDMAWSALGLGNQWQENPKAAAKLNKNSESYSPYSVGMTLNDAGLYFNVSEFTPEVIKKLEETIDWNDETAASMLRSVQAAEATTEKAEAELEKLNEKKQKWINSKYTPKRVMELVDSYMDEFCPTLKEMDKSIEKRKPIGTTRAIDYKYDDMKRGVFEACTLRDIKESGMNFVVGVANDVNKDEIDAVTGAAPFAPVVNEPAAQTTPTPPIVSGNGTDATTGAATPAAPEKKDNIIFPEESKESIFEIPTKQELEVYNAQDEVFRDTLSYIEDDLTENEAAHFSIEGTVGWQAMVKMWNGFAALLNSGKAAINTVAQKQLDGVNQKYTVAVADSAVIIKDYEDMQTNANELSTQLDVLTKMYGHLEPVDEMKHPDAQPVRSSVNGSPVDIWLKLDKETGEYKYYSGVLINQYGEEVMNADDTRFYDTIGGKQEYDKVVDRVVNGINALYKENNAAVAARPARELTEEEEAHLQQLYTIRAEKEKADAFLKDHQEEYEKAKSTEQKARNDLARSYRLASEIGFGNDGGQRHLQMVDFLIDYGRKENREKESYSDVNFLYDMARTELTAETINIPRKAVAYAKARKEEASENIDDLKYLLEYFGDSAPEDYVKEIQEKIAENQWKIDNYDYYLLSENEDWDEMLGKAEWFFNDNSGHNIPASVPLFGLLEAEERNRYIYLWEKDGPEAAQEYYIHLNKYGMLDKRGTEEQKANARAAVHDSVILANLIALGSAPLSALGSVGALFYTAITGESAEDTPFMMFNNIANAVNEETSNKIKKDLKDNPVAQTIVSSLYEIVYNRGRSLMTAAAFPFLGEFGEFVSATPMAVTAMADEVMKAYASGATDAQAWILGTVALLCEAGTETIELGHIKGAKELGLDSLSGIKDFFKQYPIAGLSEALGESLNDIIENAADVIVMGDKSEWSQRAWYYQTTMGLSKEDAEAMATRDEMYGVLHTAIISFLSPGMDVLSFASGKIALYDHYMREAKAFNDKAGFKLLTVRDIRNAERQTTISQQEAEAFNAAQEAQQKNIQTEETHGTIPQTTAETQETKTETINVPKPTRNEVTVQEKEYTTELEVLETAKASADATARSSAMASVLNFGNTDTSADRANAAAAHIEDVFENGAEDLQEIFEGGLVAEININTLKMGMLYAAIGGDESACRKVVQSEEFRTAKPDDKAAMLAQATVTDAQNRTVQDAVASTVRENRVAEKTKEIMAQGGFEETKKTGQKAGEAAAENRQAQADLENKQAEVDAAMQHNEAATNEFLNNPTKDNLKQMQSADEQLQNADISAQQYEQHKENTQAAQEKAGEEYKEAKKKELSDARQQAEEAVRAEDQQRVEIAAQQAEQERIAAEKAAQEQAQRDIESGKAEEDHRNMLIEQIADNEHLEGEERENRIKELKEQAEKVKIKIADLNKPMNNTEGFLAVNAFSRKIGLPIELADLGPVDSKRITRGKYVYDKTTGQAKIVLNQNLIKAGKMTVGQALVEASLHEIVHSMRNTNSYNAFRKVVMQSVFEGAGNSDATTMYNENARFRAKVDMLIQERVNAGDENFVGKDKPAQIEAAEDEIVADFARLNLAEKDVVERFMDAGMGGRIRNTLHNINQALKNYFGNLTGEERKTAEYLRRAERAFQKAMVESAKSDVHPNSESFSVSQMAESMNLGMVVNDDTLQLYMPDPNGNIIGDGKNGTVKGQRYVEIDGVTEGRKITPDMIVNTPVGMLIDMGLSDEEFTGKDGKVHTQKSDARQMFADLMNLCARYKDNNLVWEIAGSEFSENFSALKSNSDPQYKNTVDFGTICSKTQGIVDVLSQTMIDRVNAIRKWNEEHAAEIAAGTAKEKVFTGLNREDIMEVYNITHNSGLSVPCPVCYVFSRWMGVPGMLGQMNRFQHEYVETVKDANGKTVYDKNGDAVIDWEKTSQKANEYLQHMVKQYSGIDISSPDLTTEERQNAISVAKEKIAKEKNSINGKIRSRAKSRPNLYTQLVVLQEKLDKQDMTPAQRRKVEEQITKKEAAIKKNERESDQFMDDLKEFEAFNWVSQVVCLQHTEGRSSINDLNEDGSFVMDEKGFRLTPEEILFDLNRSGEFAGYAKNWRYRTTRGAGMGKAIMPYSGASIGDIIHGEAIRWKQSENPLLQMDRAAAETAYKSAKRRVRQQNLVGGQRFQSTSDFRPEWGLDYIMSFLEMQALGSKVQMYTKVAEAVDFLGSIGADVNLSIMAKNNGYHVATDEEIKLAETDTDEGRELKSRMGMAKDENGNTHLYVMDFSDVTGMDYNTAKGKTKKFNNVQMILVGMNDVHIRLAMGNEDIDFIIPWHSSGNSKDVLQQLVASVGEALEESSDYTDSQTDQIKSHKEGKGKKEKTIDDRSEMEIARWNARIKILTGVANKDVNTEKPNEGGFGTITFADGTTMSERELVYTDPWLSQLYSRFYEEGVDADCFGVALTKDQAEQIFPYEYWDKNSTRENADVNGERFAEYCDRLGLVPRFSQFKDDPGYWKLLIDRKMYDNNTYNSDGTVKEYGKYREQKVVDVTNARIDNDPNDTLDEETGRKKQVYQLPESTTAKYGRKHFAEETEAAIKTAGEYLSQKYDVTEQRSEFGDLTDADRDLMEDAKNDYWDAMERADYATAQEDIDYIESNGGRIDFEYMKPFDQQVDDFIEMKNAIENGDSNVENPFGESNSLLIGKSPAVFGLIQLPNLPITMNQEHLSKCIYGEGVEEKYKKSHTFSPEEFKKLPDKIANPIAIAYDPNSTKQLIVYVDMQSNSGEQVIIPLRIGGAANINNIESNVLKLDTAYSPVRNQGKNMLESAITKDSDNNPTLFYLNEKRAIESGVAPNILNVKNLTDSGLVHTITDPNSAVKIAVPFWGKGKQFNKWFSGSKVVDEDGNPRVVYHGTTEDFTVFNMGKGRTTMDILGAFFSPWEEDSAGYGDNVGSYYLSIKNPADEQTAYAALRKYQGQNEAGKKARDYLISQGYDGVINGVKGQPDEYIAFYSWQIKSANENVGTYDKTNPDTRYSASGDLTDADRDLMNNENQLNQTLVETGALTQEEVDRYNGNLPGMPLAEGGAQRQFGHKTAQESDALHQEVKDYLYTHSDYTPDSNRAQIERSIEWVQSHANENDPDGYRGAVDEVTRDDFDYRSADGQARMLTVMGMAALKGDTGTELRIADAYNKQGTDLGRQLQARKMFRLMTPVGRRMTLLQEVARINQENRNHGSDTEVGLSEWVLKAAESAETEEDFEKVRKAAEKELAEQIPANWKEKLQTWRMLSMLANPRTHVRNIVGNWFFKPVVGMKNAIGAGLESRFIKEGQERTKAIRYTDDAKAFAAQDAIAMKDMLTGEAKYSPENRIEREKKAFGQGNGLLSRTVGKAVQGIADFNSWALEAEDWIFLNKHYQNAMASYMTANNLTSADMTGKTLENARNYAVLEAQKATYRDANAVSDWLNKASRNGRIGGFLVDAVLPFKKTPANILRRGVEYSPVGLLQSLATAKKSLDLYAAWEANGFKGNMPKGAKSMNQVLDGIASGLTGTAIAALGALGYALGAVKLGFGDDDDDELKKERGGQAYSIELFGHSFTADWAAPVCMPFFTGAALWKNITDENEDADLGAFVESLLNISEPVFNLSMLDGVSSLLDSLKYAKNAGNSVLILGEKIGANYVGSLVPSFFGAAARTVDTTRRKTYVESGKPFSSWYVMVEQAQNKIPFLSMNNIPYRDVWGEPEVSNRVEALLENFLLPGYHNAMSEEKLVEELQRIYDQTGDKSVIPSAAKKTVEDIKLTDQEYDQYVVTRGQLAKQLLNELIERPEFIALTPTDISEGNPEAQAALIGEVWKYVNAVARHEIDPDYNIKSQGAWIAGAYARGDAVETIFANEEAKAKEEAAKVARANLVTAINKDNADAIDVCVEDLKRAGVTTDKIKNYLYDDFRDAYKAAYLADDDGTMQLIEDALMYIDLGEDSIKYDIFKRWMKDAEKSRN